MRISDWSSDVCSSDLSSSVAPADSSAWFQACSQPSKSVMSRLLMGRKSLTCCAARKTTEIGRASCRQSVCQYVSISVAARPLKKTTTHQHAQPPHAHNKPPPHTTPTQPTHNTT